MLYKTLAVIGIISLIVCLVYLFWPLGSATPEYISNAKYDSVLIEVAYLKDDQAKLKDSLFGLKVERGYLEIKLNQAEAAIENNINNGKEYRIKKDTVKIIQNCDSLISMVTGDYIPVVDTFRLVVYQTDTLQSHYIESVDSSFNTLDSLLASNREQLFIEREQNKSLKEKSRRKGTVFGLVGIIAGFILSLIIQK